MKKKQLLVVAGGMGALLLLAVIGKEYRSHISRGEITIIPATAPATMRIYCKPGLMSRGVPALSRAFDATPAGGTLRVVLYGPFPVAGSAGAFSLGTRLHIEQGTVTAICPDGEVQYYPNGKMILDWKTKKLEVLEANAWETPKRGLALLDFFLFKDGAGVEFSYIRLPDEDSIPSDDRASIDSHFNFSPAPGSKEEFILELRKSPDFRAGPSDFSVWRGL